MKKITKFLMLFVLCLGGMQGNAQNVTVKPSTGSMIAAVKDGGQTDTYFRRNGFATWRHNQLCLTMTTSDGKAKTENGQLANPANNIYGDTNANELQVGKGALGMTCYLNFALPKGYRFTGYQIVFSRNKSDFGTGNYTPQPNTSGTTYFGETDENFNFKNGQVEGVTYNANATMENGSTTISYEDLDGMSNILYFKVAAQRNGTESGNQESISGGSGRMVITLHSVTLWFTAEDDYTPVLPHNSIRVPVSAVDIPFQTGKVDYGSIQRRTYNGDTRVSYSSANVIDMEAYMTLYEKESVKENQIHFDGTQGAVVDYKEGSQYTIRDNGQFFVLGKKNQEQVYFLESPTYVTLPDAAKTKNPVGFRIVGAELEYQYPTAISAEVEQRVVHYITSPDGTKYMNANLQFVDEKTEWYVDGQGRIYTGTNTYLAFDGEGWGLSSRSYELFTSTGVPSRPLYVNDNNYIYGSYRPALVTFTVYLHYSASGATLSEDNGTTADRTIWKQETITTELAPAITPAPFKLHVYDKDGTLKETIEVNSAADNGTVTLSGFNNDAVKFGVEGVGFVRGSLTMQALDPYIDAMNVVCQDANSTDGIRMELPFTSDDFSVNGGEFHFFLPGDMAGKDVKISYEDLWSHYADETYTTPENGSVEHNSRFNFVNSAHYNKFTGDNIYNDIAEAASATPLERQKVTVVGDKKFRFNNASDLSTQAGTLTEYPFTQANYAGAPNNGDFAQMTFTVSNTQATKTAYVFTTDETRYNIAPTTAVQHRTYAFYEMIVHVQSATYEPKVEIVKVYDTTCYDGDATDPFYAARVTATYGDDNQAGYASDKEVEDAIDRVIAAQKDDFNHTDVPASAKQILYVDMTALEGYYKNSAAQPFGTYRSENLAPNSIIFLPQGANHNDNNFAAKVDGNNARALGNIILTDKQPFYTPFDIQVPSQYYAQYTRNLTHDTYDQDVNAMVILPYQLTLDSEGKHVNPSVVEGDGQQGKFSFTVNKMKTADLSEGSLFNYGTAYFEAVSGVEKTEANTPYMIKVDEESVDGDVISFKAIEKGALIKATTGMSSRTISDYSTPGTYNYLYYGETVTGSTVPAPELTNVTLTAEGSYSGQLYDRANSEAIFYFANNRFLNLYRLSPAYRYLYAYPFHAVYTFKGSGAQGVSALYGLDISYGDPETDGIMDLNRTAGKADLAVRSGKGFVELTATKAQTVTIRSLNGMAYTTVVLGVGDRQTVTLPSGVYVVNNAKITVK